MPKKDKHEIAALFPDKYETSQLDLEISIAEFKKFEDGFFCGMYGGQMERICHR